MKSQRRTLNRDRSTALWFLSPAILLYTVFFLFPMAQAFYVALFHWRGVSTNTQFAGLENFRNLLGFTCQNGHLVPNDPVFWSSLGHNVAFLVVSLVVIMPLGLLFASVLSGRLRGSGTYRAVFLFPNVISVVAVAVLWSFVYHPTFGILNTLLRGAGLGNYATGWLGQPKTALPAVIATSIWSSLGFYIILLLAGIQSVPRTFYEAAWIDGAGSWQSFRHITLPLIWEILKLAVIYLIINTLNVFGIVWVMTEGGPGNHTDTLLTYLYRKAFIDSEFGYATAIGVVVFVIIFAASLVSMRLMKREVVEL